MRNPHHMEACDAHRRTTLVADRHAETQEINAIKTEMTETTKNTRNTLTFTIASATERRVTEVQVMNEAELGLNKRSIEPDRLEERYEVMNRVREDGPRVTPTEREELTERGTKEPMDETSTKYAKLVGELCRRNTAAVFAAAYGERHLHVHWKRDSDPMVAMGLAGRLQHEMAAGLTSPDAPPTQTPADISQEIRDAHPPITDFTDLSLVSTAAIIAELYRIPGHWVLCLQKKNRDAEFVQFILWYGPAVSCCGLAAILQHRVSQLVSEFIDRTESPTPLDTLEGRTKFFLADLVDDATYDPLQVGGMCAHMTYEANRFRPRGPGSRNTAQDYVECDDPTYPTQGRP